MSNIEWLEAYRLDDFQFFRQWITEEWARDGGTIKKDLSLPWLAKVAVAKLGLVFPLPGIFRKKTKLIVTCGGDPAYMVWPWCYRYELVPVVWDCWPRYWQRMDRFIKRLNIKTIFCTSSQTAAYLRKENPNLTAVWLPEGVKSDEYPVGGPLRDRSIDILELGRQMPSVHNALVSSEGCRKINHVYSKSGELLFKDFKELTNGLRQSKVTVCYPRCDTNPEQAKDIETLTQRYWECMLSGTVIAGRAPKELIEICGYNPVVDLGEDITENILRIVNNIDHYQELVDKNRKCAEQKADWRYRLPIIKKAFKEAE